MSEEIIISLVALFGVIFSAVFGAFMVRYGMKIERKNSAADKKFKVYVILISYLEKLYQETHLIALHNFELLIKNKAFISSNPKPLDICVDAFKDYIFANAGELQLVGTDKLWKQLVNLDMHASMLWCELYQFDDIIHRDNRDLRHAEELYSSLQLRKEICVSQIDQIKIFLVEDLQHQPSKFLLFLKKFL